MFSFFSQDELWDINMLQVLQLGFQYFNHTNSSNSPKVVAFLIT